MRHCRASSRKIEVNLRNAQFGVVLGDVKDGGRTAVFNRNAVHQQDLIEGACVLNLVAEALDLDQSLSCLVCKYDQDPVLAIGVTVFRILVIRG